MPTYIYHILCIFHCSSLMNPGKCGKSNNNQLCLFSCVFLFCVLVCVLQKAYCGHCCERIWGLGRQGYKCINCKLLVHKRCHRLIPQTCQRPMVSTSSCPEQQVAQCQPDMFSTVTAAQPHPPDSHPVSCLSTRITKITSLKQEGVILSLQEQHV